MPVNERLKYKEAQMTMIKKIKFAKVATLAIYLIA